jgi:hypothetical protein
MSPAERRDSSNRLLRRAGIPTADVLPLIESEAEVSVRTRDEVLRRLLALWAVAGAANLPDVSFFRDFMKEHDLEAWLSPTERAFLFAPNPTEQQRIHGSWQLEPLYFLAWAAGLVETISLPTKHSTLEDVLEIFPRPGLEDSDRLRNTIAVRTTTELLDWADLHYRAHWAMRDEQLRGRRSPAGLVGGAVMEWHKAANWMICYEGEEDWDDVPTDT